MKRALIGGLISLLLAAPAFSKGGGHGSGHSSHATSSTHHGGKAAQGVARDKHGRIARSGRARAEFKKEHPCPSTGKSSGGCPGYVIDHVHPLKRGGADRPENMQWQTRQAAREKDKTE